jgi:hypothetical protein
VSKLTPRAFSKHFLFMKYGLSLANQAMNRVFQAFLILCLMCLSMGQEIHQCVHGKGLEIDISPFSLMISVHIYVATRKMTKAGDGTTEDSCMGCDPTLRECFSDCQKLVDQLYRQCDDVCLPDGYYFDPRKCPSMLLTDIIIYKIVADIAEFSLKGCWKDNKPDVKIKVERCGCNAAMPSISSINSFSLLLIILLMAVYMGL